MVLGGIAYAVHGVQMRRQATVLRELGRKAAAENDPLRAVEFYKQYLVARPDDPEAYAELAGVYEELAKSRPAFANEAIALLEDKVLSVAPNRHDDRRRLAKLYFQTGKVGAARKNLNELLASGDPAQAADPEIHLLLAHCDRRDNQPAEARKHFEAAVATKRAPVSTALELATILRYEWNTPQAIVDADALMDRAVEERPREINALLARCRYRLAAGDRRGAREDIDAAFRLPGGADDSDILLQLAALSALDDPPFARRLLEKASKAQPDNIVLTLGLCEMMVATNDAVGAQRLLLAAAAKLPDTSPHLLDLGDRLIDLGDAGAALATADRLQNAAAAGYLRGRVNILRGDWPRAIPQLEESLMAVQMNSNLHKKAQLALAVGYGVANDLPNQLKCYEAAWRIDRSSLAAQFGIADTLASLGQTAKAGERYRDLAPKHPQARVRYAQLKFAEVLALPERGRNWDEFERVLGPKPYLPEIGDLVANALFIQNKPADAMQQLATAVEADPKRLATWVSLATMRGIADADAGLKTLDEATKKYGDAVDLRLLRGQLLAKNPKSFDLAAILALAEHAEFMTTDRFRLFAGLADLLSSLNKLAEALPLLVRATAEMPFDLPTRLALFDLANGLLNHEVRDRTLDEIRKLDGADGAVTIVAEVAR